MFKKYWVSLLLLWSIFVFGCFFFLYFSSTKAKNTYQFLMNDHNEAEKEHWQEEACMTQQTRHKVSKQILYQKEGFRMQSRLTSESSDLIYLKRERELVEHFKDLTYLMQEKLIEDLHDEAREDHAQSQQIFRQFKAKEAFYSYKSGQLEAKEAEVTHYLMPGHLWSNAFDTSPPLFQGKAQTVQLLLFKEPTLKAQGFQAIFQNEGEER